MSGKVRVQWSIVTIWSHMWNTKSNYLASTLALSPDPGGVNENFKLCETGNVIVTESEISQSSFCGVFLCFSQFVYPQSSQVFVLYTSIETWRYFPSDRYTHMYSQRFNYVWHPQVVTYWVGGQLTGVVYEKSPSTRTVQYHLLLADNLPCKVLRHI